MRKKLLLILIKIIALTILVVYLINTFSINLNLDFDLYHEDHSTQKGEASLYKYSEKNYCFSDNEKQMLSDRFKILNVFNNEIFEVSECGDLGISFSVKDYKSTGDIFLYSTSSFEDLKKWIESSNYNDKIKIYDTWVVISDDEGEICFYKNENNSNFRMVYITKLPYRYMISEIDTYSPFVKYFLELNQKNGN